jgi:hypothetical protein
MIILAKDVPWRVRKTKVAMSILSPLHVKKKYFFYSAFLKQKAQGFRVKKGRGEGVGSEPIA